MTNFPQIVSVIAVIKNSANKYLLVRRNLSDEIFPGKWQNLGGKMEIGESVEQALFREIYEEVGIKIASDTSIKFLQSYSWQKDPNDIYRLGLIFLVDIGENKNPVKLSPELMEYGWFEIAEIDKLDTIGIDSPTGTRAQIKISAKKN